MMRNRLEARWIAVPLLAIGLSVLQAGTAASAPMLQTSKITAAGFVDAFPADDPNCPGCNGTYDPEDRALAAQDPLPSMEFVVRGPTGQELGRLSTQDFLGVQRAEFDVPIEDSYTVELVADPTSWQLCPNEARTRTLTQADFRLGTVTVQYDFTRGCSVAGPTATPRPGPTATLRPGETPEPTSVSRATSSPSKKKKEEGGPFGQIRGVAFIDHNQNGKIDSGEPGLNDVKVNLGGGGLEVSQITPADGTYNFPGLGPGTFDVFIDPGPEWRVTTPKKYSVPVNGTDVAGIDFGMVRVGAAPTDGAASAPRTARHFLIPAPGAGIRLPSTGLAELPRSPLLGLAVAVFGALAVVGYSADRRGNRRQ